MWGHSPDGPRVPALAGAADLPVKVLLELQAGIRGVPLEKDKQVGTVPCEATAPSPSRAARW